MAKISDHLCTSLHNRANFDSRQITFPNIALNLSSIIQNRIYLNNFILKNRLSSQIAHPARLDLPILEINHQANPFQIDLTIASKTIQNCYISSDHYYKNTATLAISSDSVQAFNFLSLGSSSVTPNLCRV